MRLIDADNYKGKVIASHCYSGVNKLINVDDVPTAYDVDKVVEQLNEKATLSRPIGWPRYIGTVPLKEAVEIVKRGAKEQE